MRHWPREVIGPEDLDMLERVLRRTLPPGCGDVEKEWRAAAIIRAYQAGAANEAELLATLQGLQPPPEFDEGASTEDD